MGGCKVLNLQLIIVELWCFIVAKTFLASVVGAWESPSLSLNSTLTNFESNRNNLYNEPFGCGFFPTRGGYHYGVYDWAANPDRLVWAANRDRPVGENATAQLTVDGNLVLRDSDGSSVWSTNTSGMSVIGMNLLVTGNLVLFDENGAFIWQSFGRGEFEQGDTLYMGQKLTVGERLQSGRFYLSLTPGMFAAFIDSSPPQMYYSRIISYACKYAVFKNGSLDFQHENGQSDFGGIDIPMTISSQILRLDEDGHLNIHEWQPRWIVGKDLFEMETCNYPTACGKYGVCSNSGQCSCPDTIVENSTNYFRLTKKLAQNLGCSLITPLSCGSLKHHFFLKVENISYFNFVDITATKYSTVESCKSACLGSCSCKAAFFGRPYPDVPELCYLTSELFTLNADKPRYTAFIKVQSLPLPTTSKPKRSKVGQTTIIGLCLGGLFTVFLTRSAWVMLHKQRRHEVEEEDYIDDLPNMPLRFSYSFLHTATRSFSKKLGKGGFGSVYEGVLGDGTQIAVKQLDGIGQGSKEFLAEVKTVGSIHHVNLVKLIGFCAEKSHRLLVYDYMHNGSLDRWIFPEYQNQILEWKIKKKVILQVAKGLSYLHEECRHRIAHLDVKPQNILLDNDFNAKLSDFGLSKLIDKEQSQVITTVRGTFGYLAPEWFYSTITEKVDVYSFGVVILEIICLRKNLDYSQPEERFHLLSHLKKMKEEDQLYTIIDSSTEDMLKNREEAIKMVQIAVWCLQYECDKRPSMSTIMKVIEGLVEIPTNLEYNFWVPPTHPHGIVSSSPVTESILSGPR